MPVIKTYEYNAYDKAESIVKGDTSLHKDAFIKAVKFYK